MKKCYLLLILILSANICIAEDDFDVVVVGGTAAGVGAAVAAARDGKSVALITRVSGIEEIGGMITNGLNFSGIGLKGSGDGDMLLTGLFKEFANKNKSEYGENDSWNGIRHTPDIASKIIRKLLDKDNINIKFYFNRVPINVHSSTDGNILSLDTKKINDIDIIPNTLHNIKGKFFIDATDCGDVATLSNVKYKFGREGTDEYNEGFAGTLYWNPVENQFLKSTPKSSKGDKKIQAYSYFFTVKKETNHNFQNVDEQLNKNNNLETQDFDYAPSFSDSWASKSGWSPGKQYVEVNVHPIGSDLQEINWNYPEATWSERLDIERKLRESCAE